VPHNSSLQFDILVPFENKIQQHRERQENYASWGWWSAETFVRVHDGVTVEDLNNKIRDFVQRQTDEDNELFAIPLADLHFYESNIKKYIHSFSVIAIIVLIMACMNFVNLSIARSGNRAKETGLRKVAGANRGNLIQQFFLETLFLLFASLLLAVGLLEILLPVFNNMTGMNLTQDLLLDSSFLPILGGVVLVTALAAGAYPAFYLSAFQPVAVLTGNIRTGPGGSKLRKSLVVVQFAASIFLIIATSIVFSQLNYIRNKDLGYDKEHVVNIPLRGGTGHRFPVLKEALLQDPNIRAVTASAASLPFWRWTTDMVDWLGKDPGNDVQVAMNMVSYDFAETYGIDILEGRDFSRSFASDSISAYVINEEMVKLMGLQNAIGAKLTIWDNPGEVIGVMKNFHFRPLDSHIQPLAFVLKDENVFNMAVRTHSGDISSALGFIEDTWKNMIPDYPFEYAFLDDQFDRTYRGLERMGDLAGSFSLLAVFIACLGLFGLASFMAEQRTREIGIRKVLGASATGIVRLLLREFAILVIVANVVSWPIAWLVMNRWLEDFAYHINPGLGVCALAGCLALTIAILTAGSQTLKAAFANPVDALKHE
jgi:ABC-type antimicrobial peptide transport system permease subunit